MAGLSDSIAAFILRLLEEDHDNIIVIQRNELANQFKCQPSQINYVLATRFSIERGFLIESQRGGNGYIRIRKIIFDDQKQCIKRLLEDQIEESISQQGAFHIIQYLEETGIITKREAKIMQTAVADATLIIPQTLRHQARASILKQMLEKLLIL